MSFALDALPGLKVVPHHQDLSKPDEVKSHTEREESKRILRVDGS